MPEMINQCNRKARVPHTCDYCGDVIQPGEEYSHAVLKLDDIYEWNSHLTCQSVAQDLWDYIDPWDGMTADDFQEGCADFCRAFICPDCEKWDKEAHEAGPQCDSSFCLHKIYDFLQTHDFKRCPDKHGYVCVWKCFAKEAQP